MVSHLKGFASGGNMVKSWVWEHPAGNVEDGLNRYKTGGKETINALKGWIRVMVEGGRVTGDHWEKYSWRETGKTEWKQAVWEGSACMQSHFSRVPLSVTLWTVARQTPLSMGFSRQGYWSGLPCPPPGDLPNPGIEPASPEAPALQADYLSLSHQVSPEGVESSTILNLKHDCLSQQRYKLI